MNWVFLVIIASAMWGIGNIIDQALRKRHIKDSVTLTIYFGLSGILLLSILLFKKMMVLDIIDILILLFTGAIWIVSALLYVHSISIEEVSRVIPLWELSPIFVLIMAFLFLGERLTQQQLLAFFLIFVGCLLISVRQIKGLFTFSKAFFPMLLSGFIFAVSNIILKFMYSRIDVWTALVWLGVGEVMCSLIILSFKKYRTNFMKSIKSIKPKIAGVVAVNESMATLGRVMYNYALLIGPTSLVYALSGTQSVFVFLYATLFSFFLPKIIKEEINKKVILPKIIAIILILIGLYFIYV